MAVHRELGNGYLELVYERALEVELDLAGIRCSRQVSFPVFYRGKRVGNFTSDMVVQNCLILELKATESICPRDEAQLINYLKASKIPVGLLLNFGCRSLKTRRFVFGYDETRQI